MRSELLEGDLGKILWFLLEHLKPEGNVYILPFGGKEVARAFRELGFPPFRPIFPTAVWSYKKRDAAASIPEGVPRKTAIHELIHACSAPLRTAEEVFIGEIITHYLAARLTPITVREPVFYLWEEIEQGMRDVGRKGFVPRHYRRFGEIMGAYVNYRFGRTTTKADVLAFAILKEKEPQKRKELFSQWYESLLDLM